MAAFPQRELSRHDSGDQLRGGQLNWQGSNSGQPLLTAYSGPGLYHFHPQLSVAGNQAVGCALYEFELKSGTYAVDVLTTFSCSDGNSFARPVVVTDSPWNRL